MRTRITFGARNEAGLDNIVTVKCSLKHVLEGKRFPDVLEEGRQWTVDILYFVLAWQILHYSAEFCTILSL